MKMVKLFHQGLSSVRQQAMISGHRRLMFVTGDRTQHSALLSDWLTDAYASAADAHIVWIAKHFEQAVESRWRVNLPHASSVQGRSIDVLVLDAWDGLNPNRLLMSAGAVSGGGLIIVLCPEFQLWPTYVDADFVSLNGQSRGQTLPQSSGNDSPYIHRWVRMLSEYIAGYGEASFVWQNNKNTWFPSIEQTLTLSDQESNSPDWPSSEALLAQSLLLTELMAGLSQSKTHEVITAPRGRGKTYVLERLLDRLLGETELGIDIVVAEKVHWSRHFRETAKAFAERVSLLTPLEAATSDPSIDRVLLVDEAASISVAMLKRLAHRYDRQVLATTVQGYEGTGRGVVHKYFSFLDRNVSHWRNHRLVAPVRWAVGDPVESLLHRITMPSDSLYAVDPSSRVLTKSVQTQQDDLSFSWVTAERLSSEEALLQEVFGLLAIAHYKTSANDLRMLLDAHNVSVLTAYSGESLVGVCLCASEGPVDDTLVESIWQGVRRPKGQLVPQMLVGQEGLKMAAELSFLRVVRIAVLPARQNQGIGEALLKQLRREAESRGVDVLASSFGASLSLMKFWCNNGFSWARLGAGQDKVSGEYAALVLLPLSQRGQALLVVQQHKLVDRFLWDYRRSWLFLDKPVLPWLLRSLPLGALSADEIEELNGFAFYHRSFDAVAPALSKWLLLYLKDGPDMTNEVMGLVSVLWLDRPLVEFRSASGHLSGVKALRGFIAQILET